MEPSVTQKESKGGESSHTRQSKWGEREYVGEDEGRKEEGREGGRSIKIAPTVAHMYWGTPWRPSPGCHLQP